MRYRVYVGPRGSRRFAAAKDQFLFKEFTTLMTRSAGRATSMAAAA